VNIANENRNDSGSALLLTMLILLVLALLIAAMTVWSKNLYSRSAASGLDLATRYGLEGAAHRGLWMLFSDISNHPSVANLDQIDYSREERFVPDARRHYFNLTGGERPYELCIVDYYSGLRVEPATLDNDFAFLENGTLSVAELDRIRTLKRRFADYVDGDSLPGRESLEAPEYALLNAPLYPRNAPALLPEEYLAIPGVEELFPPDSYGRMPWLMPAGTDAKVKPNLFAAPRELVLKLVDAGESGRENLEEAFRLWREKGYTVEFTMSMLDEQLWKAISEKFSLEESGRYVLLVRPMAESGRRGRSAEVVIEVDRATGVGAPTVVNLVSFRFL